MNRSIRAGFLAFVAGCALANPLLERQPDGRWVLQRTVMTFIS